MPIRGFKVGDGEAKILRYLSDSNEADYSKLKSHLLATEAYVSKQQGHSMVILMLI